MANCVNQIFLLGSSGKDAEIRATGSGTLIATFTVATSEGRKDAQGNWKDETHWHNIKAFGRSAEIARDQVKKGAKVFVEGKLTTETWDDKQTGQKRYKSVIVAQYLSVVPNGRTPAQGNDADARQHSETPAQRLPDSLERLVKSTEITDDDIPF